MDRLAKLRCRSSTGSGPLNASSTSMGNAAGYETANDDSLTSGCSMYFSINEGDTDEQPVLEKTLDAKEPSSDSTIDKTLENDFSVGEVSTIRKPILAHASPATVKIASKMSVKYLGVSSTPAKSLKDTEKAKMKTPASKKVNISGVVKLNDTNDKNCSLMEKMREPKVSESSSVEDGNESKLIMDSSVVPVPQESNKSFGTNILANFFATLDVNKCTPLPEIKVIQPEEVQSDTTPSKSRDSNSLQSFFESLKKYPTESEKENKQTDRRKSLRKSLIPSKSIDERPKTRNSILVATSENRVASPISKTTRKSNLVKLIPDKLKEMRKANQSDLVTFQRKSTIPLPKIVTSAAASKTTVSAKSVTIEQDIIGDSIKVNGNRKSIFPPTTKPSPSVALKRKTIAPMAVTSRRSVLPAKNSRRSVIPPANTALQKTVPLRIPAKTTITSSDTSLKSSLGKRSSTLIPAEGGEPMTKLRKSLAPVKEISPRVSPRATTAKTSSRIRPPNVTVASSSTTAVMNFKKPEIFTCDTCQRSFRLKSSLDSHRKLTHQSGSLTSTPSASTNSKSNDSSTENQCRFCSKSFANPKFLSNHVISNCLKIPPLEKRKLLAQREDQQRAANNRSGERSNVSRITTRPKLDSAGSSNSSNRSVDAPPSDTSTSSSIGDTSSASLSSQGVSKKRNKATDKQRTVGHTGITRTPKKEIKCHHCSKKFINAVEYALHVQAHAKGGLQPLKDLVTQNQKTDVPSQLPEVAKLVQKLTNIKNRVNSK
ncbi:serine-rich adhesin for platelets-like [Malaya genurostris]|uniref:serine-rich adhesin for platelets-like n=1 Tax=Malaya genurostris TaxID=325434 RepID=UPI0026F38AD9|nr:serine-rich adhesin for platelets-like [Malaya genurostris]XP_058444120.1 serine-rich adhesin for platelets-like [Malaya genurostris]